LNLRHAKNNSPETLALIGLVETYVAKPILFTDFPKNLVGYFRSKPTTTEMTDIIYYHSFYALTYIEMELDKYMEGIKQLNS